MRIDLLARRWGGPDGGRDGMSIAVSYLAWTLAELGHTLRCYLAEGTPPPWHHPQVTWIARAPLNVPDDWTAELVVTTINPAWRRIALDASRARATRRLIYWHHHGSIPPGYGCVLARVAPGEPAQGWSREILLPPSSWAASATGEQPSGRCIVVPGAGRGKGGEVALVVARAITDVPWFVLPGRAGEHELAPWRGLSHVVVAAPGLAPERWLAQARLVLSPSRAETYGLAMVEAAVRGIPVVTSDLPGPRWALGESATFLPMDAPAAAWIAAARDRLAQPSQSLVLPSYAERACLALGVAPLAAHSVLGSRPAPVPVPPPQQRPAVPATPGRPVSRSPAPLPDPTPSPYPDGARLHLGCGKKLLDGWLNTDGMPGLGPDGVVDLAHPEQLPAATFGAIYACHVLEHVYYHDTPRILRGLLGALQPGGLLLLSVPDLRLAIRWIESGRGDPNNPIFGNLRAAAHECDRHKQGFWRERLEKLLADAGYVDVRPWVPEEHPEIAAAQDWSSHPEISLNLCGKRPGTLPAPRTEPSLDDPAEPLPRCHPAGVDVSCILGTVDRPEMIRECIESIRASLAGSCYSHEIVVAYGREDDPALPWLREQTDVVLLCGGVDGAIPAFNAAYLAARRGRYLCQVNDDVLIEGPSLAIAIRRLDERPDLGVVVFSSSLDGGKTRYVPRAEEGVVHPNQLVARREALEDVIAAGFGAFWGGPEERTHKTYGGDTILGMWLHRLGWRVERCDDVRCLDRCREPEARDDLRRGNMEGFQEHRADMAARYPRAEFSAPIARAADGWPSIYVPERGALPRRSPVAAGPPERVLHLSLAHRNSSSHPSLEAALGELGPYSCVRWAQLQRQSGAHGVRTAVLDGIRAHRPTLIWMQIQQNSVFSDQGFLAAMRAAAPPGCLIVSWTGDVRTDLGDPCEPWQIQQCQGIDLFLASNCTYPVELRQAHRVPARTGYMLCAADAEQNKPRPEARPEDWAGAGQAVFVGGDHLCYRRSTRMSLLRAVHRALPGQLHIYGTGQWGDLPASPAITREERSYLHSVAGVVLSHSLFTRLRRYTSGRLPDALLCGACVAVQTFDDLEGLGVRDGEHLLVWRDEHDLVELLRDWLRPERAADRRRMGQAAREHALQHLTWTAAIEGMMAIVREERRRRSCR